MIEIEVSKDIKAHEVKIIGPFTGRQLTCIGISLMYGIPILMVTPGSFLIKSVVAIVLMMPTIMCGWCKLYGLPLEKYMLKVIRTMLRPKDRKYETRNRYEYLVDKDQPIRHVDRTNQGGFR